MSIHKSKGLEFEVVIVPDLQAGCGRGDRRLLSWLERGLEADDDFGDITEFLVAPLPSKGGESGKCKAWVDRVCHVRESQETRRILYVAATRAREELHLFARPEYKTEQDGSYSLCSLRESLLATAWPALESEVRSRFDAWAKKPASFECRFDRRIRCEQPSDDAESRAACDRPAASLRSMQHPQQVSRLLVERARCAALSGAATLPAPRGRHAVARTGKRGAFAAGRTGPAARRAGMAGRARSIAAF